MNTEPEKPSVQDTATNPMDLTEEEATRYDRQMRLWGIEAQQRMRNATILVVKLGGVATEAIKNVVLAGIGKLIIVDDENVREEDLGAGFFFRDSDVGRKRLDAAKSRIESLNPLVTVETITENSASNEEWLESVVKTVDLVCVTDWNRDGLIRINDLCRKYNKPFYAGGTYGLYGYIFCDLLEHEYLSPDRTVPKEQAKTVKTTMNYSSLSSALTYRWTALTKRKAKELNPAPLFAILGKHPCVWQFQSTHGYLPDDSTLADDLEKISNSILTQADVNKQVLPAIPRNVVESFATTAAHEFSPICAIVGGMLAQDILKALGGRDAPIANFFVFDGTIGGGTVCRLDMP
ncbi:hypothetical protein CVT24_007964 [Panaeolus cyanescens]|uniref:Ubiquitin-like 1-activating enzyme E1A n=1 Tax=Panaeolus cyanescens TaxID=181874 RepID=A0A409YQS5_9AGAR|nr:hypothetical protein CVT24_007964 [Panaeolus cyanescens]